MHKLTWPHLRSHTHTRVQRNLKLRLRATFDFRTLSAPLRAPETERKWQQTNKHMHAVAREEKVATELLGLPDGSHEPLRVFGRFKASFEP